MTLIHLSSLCNYTLFKYNQNRYFYHVISRGFKLYIQSNSTYFIELYGILLNLIFSFYSIVRNKVWAKRTRKFDFIYINNIFVNESKKNDIFNHESFIKGFFKTDNFLNSSQYHNLVLQKSFLIGLNIIKIGLLYKKLWSKKLPSSTFFYHLFINLLRKSMTSILICEKSVLFYDSISARCLLKLYLYILKDMVAETNKINAVTKKIIFNSFIYSEFKWILLLYTVLIRTKKYRNIMGMLYSLSINKTIPKLRELLKQVLSKNSNKIQILFSLELWIFEWVLLSYFRVLYINDYKKLDFSYYNIKGKLIEDYTMAMYRYFFKFILFNEENNYFIALMLNHNKKHTKKLKVPDNFVLLNNIKWIQKSAKDTNCYSFKIVIGFTFKYLVKRKKLNFIKKLWLKLIKLNTNNLVIRECVLANYMLTNCYQNIKEIKILNFEIIKNLLVNYLRSNDQYKKNSFPELMRIKNIYVESFQLTELFFTSLIELIELLCTYKSTILIYDILLKNYHYRKLIRNYVEYIKIKCSTYIQIKKLARIIEFMPTININKTTYLMVMHFTKLALQKSNNYYNLFQKLLLKGYGRYYNILFVLYCSLEIKNRNINKLISFIGKYFNILMKKTSSKYIFYLLIHVSKKRSLKDFLSFIISLLKNIHFYKLGNHLLLKTSILLVYFLFSLNIQNETRHILYNLLFTSKERNKVFLKSVILNYEVFNRENRY
uniref:Uncharacterized protein n=1 Tax=Amorphochlora amoebiformis TaxID=1561963 RepID=A0A0H5BIK9_9EUKA|nr:hypothetical protein [Amorphochlora amoebiformis]